jgi:hypothetical protein
MSLLVGPTNGCILDEMVHLVLVLVVERRDADDHLVHQDAEGPPI